MNLKTAYKLGNLCELLGLAIILASSFLGNTDKGLHMSIAGLVVTLIGFAVHLVFYRCPYCKGSLSSRGKKKKVGMNICPNCGRKLD